MKSEVPPHSATTKQQRQKKTKPMLEFCFCPKSLNRLRPLQSVFEKLRHFHEQYIKFEVYPREGCGDCAFWYGERPHVGLLAAAIWLDGGIALEEYGTDKTIASRRKRGRADSKKRYKYPGFLLVIREW